MDEAERCARVPIAAAGWRRILFYLLQFTRGLSVNLPGLLVFLCCRNHFRSEPFCNSIVTYLSGDCGSLSLGVFVFLSTHDVRRLRAHEYGHTVQCLFLGPLYWIVVMLPSALWYHFFGAYRAKRRSLLYWTLKLDKERFVWESSQSKR